MSNSRLYDQDFFAWANEQAALLRAGRLSEADIENIAEEIDTMGRSEKRELVSRLKVLLTHLLKWRFQPTLRGTSWRLTIEEQRREVADHMADNPSLKDRLPEAMASAFAGAILVAARETGFDRATFAPAGTWSFEQIMTDDFYPDDGT
jgi:ribosomal protein L29